jgi:hypothetical protein
LSSLFMHFLTKITDVHTDAIWVGDSIFYNSKPLTVGWGIEIEEVRHWMLFCVAQLVVLLLSDGLAGLYAFLRRGVPSGLALGA